VCTITQLTSNTDDFFSPKAAARDIPRPLAFHFYVQ
jgi:hypothetical protein